MASEIIAGKQIEVPPDGIARCYWWRHLEDELGFLADQPPDPDGWQLRTSDSASSMSSGTAPTGRTHGWRPGRARLLPSKISQRTPSDAHHAA